MELLPDFAGLSTRRSKNDILDLEREPAQEIDKTCPSIGTLDFQQVDFRYGNHEPLIIAHRLATIQQCDRIYVMEYGEIIEAGTHNESLSCKGKYAELWERQ